MNPDGWTAGDESDYQQVLANLEARIAAAGPSDDIALVVAEYTMLTDAEHGKQEYLKAKANGWL